MSEQEDRDNNLIAAGAVWALLLQRIGETLTTAEVVHDAEGNYTNQLDITLSFMGSPYRITVERVTP